MDALWNHLNVKVDGGAKSDATVIKSVPDYFHYLKPKLVSKDLATSICEYLSHKTHELYDKCTPDEKNKGKHFIKNFKPTSELIGAFTSLGYPKFDKYNGMTHNRWKSNLWNITKSWVANLTKFVTTLGMKTKRSYLSKSWLIQSKNSRPIKVEIKRRQDKAALQAVNGSTRVITADTVMNNNDIVSNVHENNSDDVEDVNNVEGDKNDNCKIK